MKIDWQSKANPDSVSEAASILVPKPRGAILEGGLRVDAGRR